MRDNDDESGRGLRGRGISKNLELFWRDLAVTGPFVRCSSLENENDKA